MLATVSLGLVLLTAPPASPAAVPAVAPADTVPWGTLRGTVQSEPGGAPVPQAVVELQGGARSFATTADSAGAYVLRHVPAGRQTLRVRHLGHAPFEMDVLVPAGSEMVLHVLLAQRTLRLDTVQVVGGGALGADSVAASRPEVVGALDVRAIESGNGVAGAGIGQRTGTAGNDPADPRDVLYVRGSAADLKLVLLDGAPVFAPFHTGGLIETFEPGVLRSARLHLGGAPARYDGGLSYVLDLATRAPNHERHSGSGGVDMMSAQALLEGPILRGVAYLVSGRMVHGASVSQFEDQPFPYRYEDGLGRVDLSLGEEGRISVMGFANREGVRVDTTAGRPRFADWGNRAGSVRFRGPIAGADGEITAALGEFHAAFPRGSVRRDAQIRRLRLGLDLTRDEGAVRLRYGWSYDRTWAHHRVLDEAAGRRREVLDAVSAGDVGGVYVDAAWQATPRLMLRGGMRSDMFSDGPGMALAPRAAATWLLSDRAALTLAAGRYHQYVRVKPDWGIDLPGNDIADSLGIATQLRMASADHLSLALDQELVEGTRLGLEGFYKRFDGIPMADQIGAFNSGVDVWVRRASGAVDGWLGYSLAWTWARARDCGKKDCFDGRQILSAGVGGRLGRAGRFGVRVAYGAGLPYTGIGIGDQASVPGGVEDDPGRGASGSGDEPFVDQDAPLDEVTPDPYLRLDAELSRTWTPRLGSRETELTPYLRVLNALDRRDALFYRYDPDDDASRGVATLPFLPIVGFEWKF